ncbi:hypothetical protein LTR66_017008 [Elasticomyces elasticus]|nr:hypothetical protein LTR66_017008 [Elasticomyces elasticus]
MSKRSAHPLSKVKPSRDPQAQSQSPLLRLPAEIRLEILRELLVSAENLGSPKTYPSPRIEALPPTPRRQRRPQKAKDKLDPKGYYHDNQTPSSAAKQTQSKKPVPAVKYVQGHHLYPSILRTCQTLLREGLPLLYGENALNIEIRHASNIPYGSRYVSAVIPAGSPIGTVGFHVGTSSSTTYFNLEPLLERFSNVLIDLNLRDFHPKSPLMGRWQYKYARKVFTRLGQLLAGKAVSVSAGIDDSMVPTHERDLVKLKEQINLVQLIRCESLSISTPARLVTDIEGIIKVATGTSRVFSAMKTENVLDKVYNMLQMSMSSSDHTARAQVQ